MSLKELAEKLNVSPSTVSRALSGKPGVSEVKRKEIIREARALGFKPDSTASSLRTGRGREATIIVGLKGPEIMLQRNHILFDLAKKQFGSIRVVSMGEDDDINDLIWDAAAGRSKAIISTTKGGIILPETIKLLKNRRIPFVSVDDKREGLDSVLIDRSAGTYQAAMLLLLSGCRQPVFFSNNTLDQPDSRLRGIIRAYEELGRPKEEIDIIPMNRWPSGYNGGYLIAKELFSRRNVDGIFAYSDVVAIGVSRAVAKAGLGIPADVKLIGFDNIEAAEYLPVSLSTVAQPEFEPVKAALELAMERTGDFERPPREVVFPSSLIARESCPLNDNSLREKIFSPVSKNK